MSFIQNSEEFQNLRKERDSRLVQSKEFRLPKVNSDMTPPRQSKQNTYNREINEQRIQSQPQFAEPRGQKKMYREPQEHMTRSERLDVKHDKLSNKLQNLKEQKRETLAQLNEDKKKLQMKLENLNDRRNRTKLLKKDKYLSHQEVNFYEEPLYHHQYFNQDYAPQTSSVFGYSSVPSTTYVQSRQPDYVLREMPVDNYHDLNYYYPYFYKTQILKSYNSLNYASLKSNCLDFNCRWCNSVTNACEECANGYFLYGNTCVTSCQIGFVANNYRRSCVSAPTGI